jgi:hypothetical protein
MAYFVCFVHLIGALIFIAMILFDCIPIPDVSSLCGFISMLTTSNFNRLQTDLVEEMYLMKTRQSVLVIEQPMKSRGNKQAFTELPLFKRIDSQINSYLHAHNAMQTDVIFLQQDETADLNNISSFVINLNNILYSIIAGPRAGSVFLKDKMMNAYVRRRLRLRTKLKGI